MAESKLLKEAIADAKAVRETAIANAKLALEEAFTPKLQSMLSKKIEEEAEDTDEDELEEQSDSSGLGKGDNKVDQVDGDDYENAETEKWKKLKTWTKVLTKKTKTWKKLKTWMKLKKLKTWTKTST